MMHLASQGDLVHSPLAHWAQTRGDAPAISSSGRSLTFVQLHAAVQAKSADLIQSRAPSTVLVDSSLAAVDRIVAFLAIVASGRCAAVGDPDWPIAVQQAVTASMPTANANMDSPRSDTPFYVGFTSGSTGTPKGYRRHHRSWSESFRVCLETFGPAASTRILIPGKDSHSLFLFGVMLGLWTGAGVVLQAQFSAGAALDTLQSGSTPCLVAVPSQLLLMLEVAQHRKTPPIRDVHLIMVSGSRWNRSRTADLKGLFPNARIVEFYGASETSFVAWMDADASVPAHVVGRPFSNVEVQIRKDCAEDSAGLIFVRSPMVFMDYFGVTTDGTAAVRDGDWLSVRDLGTLDGQGRLCLEGRQNRMIVTRGKNLFPEELESVLESHPAIGNASVHGVDDALRGRQVVAVIRWSSTITGTLPDAHELSAWCMQHLEAYKSPRQFLVSAQWCWTASGKSDHLALGTALDQHFSGASKASSPWLLPLR